MKTIQKLTSLMMVTTLITSQIGCAGKVTKISEPMDQVKFDKDYTYNVQVRGGQLIRNVEGSDITSEKNNLVLKTKTEERTIKGQDTYRIIGVSKESEGNYAGRGILIGAGVGAIPGIIGFASVATHDYSDCSGSAACANPRAFGYAAATIISIIGPIIGGLVGLGVGSLIQKRNRIEISPIIEPTKTGSVNAGANLGVTF